MRAEIAVGIVLAITGCQTETCPPGSNPSSFFCHRDAGVADGQTDGPATDAHADAHTLDMGIVDLGPDLDVPDGSVLPDLGVPDLDVPDLGLPDLGLPDTGVVLDLGVPDTGVVLDLSVPDTGVALDLGVPDAGIDLGVPDLGLADLGSPDLGVLPDLGLPDVGLPDLGLPACVPMSGCTVNAPGATCGVVVAIVPYFTGGPSGGFQSVPGTGFQTTMVITFTSPVDSATLTIIDPDFSDNQMIAFDALGTELGRVSFIGDGTPGVLTTDTETITAAGISRIDLVPNAADYVAYQDLVFNGCF